MNTNLVQDLRTAWRSLRAAPLVTGVVMASMALAIGANTGIFAIANSLLLRPLPISNPATLVHVTDSVLDETGEQRIRAWSNPVWEQIRERPDLFGGAAAWSATRFDRATGGEAQFVDGLWVDGQFFETLGVPAAAGRLLTAQDDRRGGGPNGPVAVISHDYWRRAFGGDHGAIGQVIRLNGVPATIVGVTDREFFGLEVGRTFDVAVPLAMEALMRGADSVLDSAGTNFLSIVARLKAGQSLTTASDELRRVQPTIREATLGPWDRSVAERYLTSPFAAVPAALGSSALRRAYGRPVLIIAAIVAAILLIACLNIANLLLARALARRSQVSVQLALGAARTRIMRQQLMESLILAAGGALLGLGVASIGSRFLVDQLASPVNRVFLDLSLDWRVLTFTIAIATASALLFGLFPAWRAAGAPPIDALRHHGRPGAMSGRIGPMEWLVAAQVALSLVLMVGAILFGRSFAALATRDLGFEPGPVLVATIDGQRVAGNGAERVAVYDRVRQAVSTLPVVTDAAISFLTPLGSGGFTPAIEVAGDNAGPVHVPADADVVGNLVSPRWFATYGTQLVAGRDFADGDRRGAPGAAIVNEAFVRRFLLRDVALGRSVTLYPGSPRAMPMRIVGVVEDATYGSPRAPVPPTWYIPITQAPPLGLATVRLTVRVRAGSPLLATRDVAAAMATVDPRLTVTFRSLDDQLRGVLTRDRLIAQLAGFFGVLALVLSGLGLYGVTAYAVSLRRAEVGIRMALGAAPWRIASDTLWRMAQVTGAGAIVGVALSLWGGQLVAGLLYGLVPQDPIAIGGAALALVLLGIIAASIPARRAARMDPAAILR